MNIPPGRKIPIGGTRYPLGEPGRPAKVGTNREPRQVDASAVTYSAGYNSTTGTPSGDLDGVETPVGRVWAEARSVTASGGATAITVTLVVTQRGVRALVKAASGTIAGGSVRFWVQNHLTKGWALGGVDETLATGAAEVSTTDQLIAVGS